ncbi:S8 family serine peptidase [Halorubellus sp. PRR65]|uniref:S8 family serine peptidase n=1 Tax=Halorubellus sp. PRR65 TaxID=3098148 RepID=UPI002B25E835|nr:S8 family serine peptidase [Halorubellus sp. PRR65]
MVEDSIPDSSRRTFLKAAGAAGAAMTVTTTVSAETGTTRNRVNLGLSNTVSMSTAQAEIQSETPADSEIYRTSETLGFVSVDVPESEADQVIETFQQRDSIRYAEYDQQLHAFATPNDELYDQQYAPQQVRAAQAYDTTDGSSDVTISVVDQGVYYDHPDLQAQFGSLKGKDFVDDDADPAPDSMADEYHGTHVAGIASATTDNATGIAGISDSTLLSGRALSEQGSGSTADIAEAVRWSADNGADIINMSLGGGGYTDTMKNAVSYAVSNGALPICAAGNDGSSSVSYPAAYSECVAVSAVDSNEELASFSQYGDKCDVAAPGVDILSTWTEQTSYGEYNKISGTSMACPAASGVAALGLAADSSLGPNELRARLKNTAADIGLSEQKQGSGRVDALNIVEAGTVPDNQAPTVSINASSTTVEVGTAVEFDGTGSSDPDGSIESYDWDFDNGATATGPSATFTFENAGTFDVQLTVTDDDGASSTNAISVTVEEGDDGDNQAPTVSIDAGATTIPVGAEVEFDGSASSDSDGSIESYAWDFGDGTTDTTATVMHAYDQAGEYTVSLTVTDDDGASSTKSLDVTVEPDQGGSCGDTSTNSSAQGSLRGWYDDENFTFVPDLDDPCQVTFHLEGGRRVDFDLYVTFDGRTPSTYDYDARSITYGPDEQIVVDDVDSDQEFGILVDAYRGRGSFTVSVDEIGK